jgi:hypothetical protein
MVNVMSSHGEQRMCFPSCHSGLTLYPDRLVQPPLHRGTMPTGAAVPAHVHKTL